MFIADEYRGNPSVTGEETEVTAGAKAREALLLTTGTVLKE